MELTRNSKIILADLVRAKRPLSIRQIAQRNNVAWKTAKDNVDKLKRRGAVNCKITKRKTYCEVNPQLRKRFD